MQLFSLRGNQLTGSLPDTLDNMTSLFDGSSDLRWNALYTADDTLRAFLNTKQNGGDWESTQTIAPAGLAPGVVTETTAVLSWTPISYSGDEGRYEIEYATVSGGPYTLSGVTDSKSEESFVVTGLESGTPYFFQVRTVTEPHADNQNEVASEYTVEVTTTTAGFLDSDTDGLPDAWEQQIIDADPNDGITNIDDVLPGDDFDDDGVTNADELANGISPINPDSDGDGYNDGQEIAAGTSPLDNTEYGRPATGGAHGALQRHQR